MKNLTAQQPLKAMAQLAWRAALITASGLMTGGRPLAFLTAAAAVVLTGWIARNYRPRTRRRYLILDPQAPDAGRLAAALSTAVEEAARSRQALILRIATLTAGPRYRPRLCLTPTGDIEISGTPRKHAIGHPGVWLADHPLPLDIPLAKSLTLAFLPCAGTRVRVTLNTPPQTHRYIWLGATAAIALACYCSLNTLLAATLCCAGETYLAHRD